MVAAVQGHFPSGWPVWFVPGGPDGLGGPGGPVGPAGGPGSWRRL